MTRFKAYFDEALAAQKRADEPVAWMGHHCDSVNGNTGIFAVTQSEILVSTWKRKGWTIEPLYIRPQPATWVGLTDVEFAMIVDKNYGLEPEQIATTVCALTEAKLKEKNSAPQRQPLTDEQIAEIRWTCRWSHTSTADPVMRCTQQQMDDFARAIEAAHGIGGDK